MNGQKYTKKCAKVNKKKTGIPTLLLFFLNYYYNSRKKIVHTKIYEIKPKL